MCDDSKRDLEFEDWMSSNVRSSPKSRGVKDISERTVQIRAYVNHHNYRAMSLEGRSGSERLRRLNEIQTRLEQVRGDIEILINDYRAQQTGMK